MKTLDQWMDHYAISHQNPTNKLVHKVCVPIINLTVVGLFWVIPTPELFNSIPYLNWATIASALALVFYFRLSTQAFLIMAVKLGIMLWICSLFQNKTTLLYYSISLFIISWIGQFIGHKIEGQKPSFFEDLQFLLIGPLWVSRAITGYPIK